MILVVDDEPSIRSLVRSTLEGAGYEVKTVASGEKALAVARGEPPEALITDITMPGMSGLELADLLRADFRDLPVVYITGYSDHSDSEPVPGSVVVSKPFSRAQLGEALSQVLAVQRSG